MAIDKKPLAFFIYLFGLFIFSIRGKHNNSFKTWFCGAAQQASHARKFLLSELPPSDRQDCSLPAGEGREPSWRWLSQGQRGAWDTTSGSARPWLSKWLLRVCSAQPWARVLQAEQERNWFMLDSSTAGWSSVCCDPGGGMAFLLNLKDAHSSSHGTQNLSGVFHKWERHPGTAIRVTNRTSSWPGTVSKI